MEWTVELTPPAGRTLLHWRDRHVPARIAVPAARDIEQFGGGEHLLLHGENQDALAWLLANGYREQVNLAYIDPPFGSGIDRTRRVRPRGVASTRPLAAPAAEYHDTWDDDAYLQFMFERLCALRDLLAADGCIYLHCDFRKAHVLRCLMDEVFGAERMLNEIIWFYPRGGDGERQFNRKHDTLLLYAKGERWIFNYDAVLTPYNRRQLARFNREDAQGRFYWNVNPRGERVKTYLRKPGIGAYDVWTIPIDARLARDLGYPTLKPPALLERIVRASSRPGDLVLDCFAGSGAAAVAAHTLGRRWIAGDINPGAIQISARRMRRAAAGFTLKRIGLPPSAPGGDVSVQARRAGAQLQLTIAGYHPAHTALPPHSDWRALIDEVLIDPAYDGQLFRPAIIDAPACRAELVRGEYRIDLRDAMPAIAIKVVDVLGGESFQVL